MRKPQRDNPIEEVGDYMTAPVLDIDADTTIRSAADLMQEKNIGSLLVKQGDEFVGIITETDLTRKVIVKGLDTEKSRVKEIMTSPLETIDCHESVLDANKLMAKKKIRHLAVKDNDKVVGLLSVRDLIHYFANPRMRTF